ncbi:MAG TPA: alpha/beta hydrolase [Candidatus Acidoferrales bacterium]|nr:alpha/beta hydrolase [Candidatus Acidoferrales bacterium]
MKWTSARSRLRTGMVKAGRLQLHHTYGGSGSPPVVFIHGLGSSGYIEWRFNLEPISQQHRVFAPDLPGYGRSHKPRARYDIEYFARAVDRYMESRRLRSAVVVGASLGGRVALEMALEYPRRVSRLVLVNALGLGRPNLQLYYPLVTLPRVGETLMRLAGEALHWAPAPMIRRVAARYSGSGANLERTLDDGYLADLREMYAQEGFNQAYLATVRSLAHPATLLGRHDLSRRLAEIKVPVLLIWGADDPLFPVAHATRAHARLPDSRLSVIEGAGHSPQAERPDEFNRILGRFLR